MMGIKERIFQPLPDVSLDDLVPPDHFYRRLEHRLDLSFVRELVRPCYASGGRPSIDPVVFFKLQLVMFFEGIRSERQLMSVAADRLSLRWYLGYDLRETLPDHSSLTCIRERYGLDVFRRFFDAIVELCVKAGLVWGKELYFDATKVEANAALESLAPRFAVEAHLADLFEDDLSKTEDDATGGPRSRLDSLPTADDEKRTAANGARSDWISRGGRQNRSTSGYRRRTADLRASKTDPDASPMRRGEGRTRLGYHAHYVVDGGRSRIILAALVTPFEVMENQPMLDLLWRSRFRWRLKLHQATGDATYGTIENVVAIEEAGIRAYLSLPGSGKSASFFSKDDFVYDDERDAYTCPRGEPLRLEAHDRATRRKRYRAKAEACDACPLKPKCTTNKLGRIVMRNFDEEYLDRVRAYRETEPYRKALRKRKVWVEPLFAEAKEWHGMRRFRLRKLRKVNMEALIVAAGQNIKRLLGASRRGPRSLPQAAALRLPEPPFYSRCRARRCHRYVPRHRRRRSFSTRWNVFGTPYSVFTNC